MTVSYYRLGSIAIAGMVAGACFAGPENLPPPASGSTEGAVEFTAPPAAGIPYYEYFHYSSYAKRSYVPGYTPHVTSLFENPRDYPWALCVLATPYYQYAGVDGWFFGSPQGYQSSVPPGSHASAYFRGETGITADLRGGYPQGMRVVEPAIVPVSASSEKGGIFIQGGGTTLMDVPVETEVITETEITRVDNGPVAPPPTPLPGPAVPEK